jgi:hypothetical protein
MVLLRPGVVLSAMAQTFPPDSAQLMASASTATSPSNPAALTIGARVCMVR